MIISFKWKNHKVKTIYIVLIQVINADVMQYQYTENNKTR